ncbi:MAG: Re/Si-specific NAD(P)(+) transhydrogenase subunit alpha [Alphaproteobacteria bacterium]|nr:Re/Si-specific NAD(P)(+) transhydrogenase subunit alpha [Alphaproteobacteria bacterium]
MKIAVLRETKPNETRVAASPETVKKFVGLGVEVAVEAGAGEAASMPDAAYKDAGATIAKDAKSAAKGAALALKVLGPTEAEIAALPRGCAIVSIVAPHANGDLLNAAAKAGIDLFAMDLMPRITRAQSMDVLSSQSNLAGYKAVIDAAAYIGSAMPMMMTAAGTIAPAKVFVMGAGVAGLQAIATARRLGAVVSATDVRFAAKEQVESLGATFVVVDEAAMKEAETEGGYAKEMSQDFQTRQAEFVAEHIKKQDIVVTTALIPGRPAPRLVSEEMVRSMRKGSVIVDLAAEQGGNVALTRPGETVDVDGVSIIGHRNVPGRLAADASALYARNVFNFVSTFFDKDSGTFPTDWDDDIVKAIALVRAGAIIHPQFAGEPATAAPEAETGAEPEDQAPAESNGETDNA